MQKLDAAYRKQDVDAVNALRAEWEASRQPVHAQEVAGGLVRAWLFGELTTDDYADQTRICGEVVRVTRQIGQAKRRIDDIQPMLDDLKASDLHRLYSEHMTRLDSGVSLLDEMAAKLDVQIADAEREDSDARPPGALGPCDAGDLFARGRADLDRWAENQRARSGEPRYRADCNGPHGGGSPVRFQRGAVGPAAAGSRPCIPCGAARIAARPEPVARIRQGRRKGARQGPRTAEGGRAGGLRSMEPGDARRA